MNSRKSWVNIPLLKNIIKNNLFPAKVSLIIFFGVFILTMISSDSVGQVCIFIFAISAVVLTTIYPCFLHNYLVNKTKSAMMNSLPLSTRCIWFTNYLAGYLIALVTLLVEGLGVVAFLGLHSYNSGINLLGRFIITIIVLLFIYYSIAYLVCCMSGNRLGQVFFSLAAYAIPVIFLLSFIYIGPRLVPMLNNSIDNFYVYTTFPLAAGLDFVTNGSGYLLFHFFMSIGVFVLSYYVYKNRDDEYIGEPLVFRKITIILKAGLIGVVTICGFGIILLLAQIDITYGIKGVSLMFLIYMMIGIITAIIVEIIFKSNYIYRRLLIYVPILIVIFGANYMVLNHQYLNIVNVNDGELQGGLTLYNESNDETFTLTMNNEMVKSLQKYLSKHRDAIHLSNYINEKEYIFMYANHVDGTYYNQFYSANYNLDKDTVIDYFNGPGKRYFDQLYNFSDGLAKEKYLTCYTGEKTLYLNKTEINQLVAATANQRVDAKDMFKLKTYSFYDLNNQLYLVVSNDIVNEIINSPTLIKRSVFLDDAQRFFADILAEYSEDYNDKIREVLSDQLKSETIDLYYSDDNHIESFDDNNICYEVDYEVVTKIGNSYSCKLIFDLRKENENIVISDIKVESFELKNDNENNVISDVRRGD